MKRGTPGRRALILRRAAGCAVAVIAVWTVAVPAPHLAAPGAPDTPGTRPGPVAAPEPAATSDRAVAPDAAASGGPAVTPNAGPAVMPEAVAAPGPATPAGAAGAPGPATGPGPAAAPGPAAPEGAAGPATASAPEPAGPPAPAPRHGPIRRNIARMAPHQFAIITKPELMRGSNRRSIVLNPHGVTLWAGDRPLWTGRFRTVHPPGRARSLADVAALVARSPHPRWLFRVKPGVYQLDSAFTQARRTHLEVAAPRVRELRMISDGEVYLSGVAATARFDGTHVLSWRPDGRGPDTTPDRRRPFIAYKEARSVLVLRGSRFSYLGGDLSNGYGVTWAPGSTGSAVGCTFDHNFFGAYTGGASDVVFRHNIFRNNDIYGLDPHTGSDRLIMEDNEAFGNGSHGIIISKDVQYSRIARNRSHHNQGNGIMIDYSDDNMVVDNRSWGNDRDGIVLQHSARVLVRGNHVTDNRVGVRITSRSTEATIERNQITGNQIGLEIYNVPRGAGANPRPVTITDNEIDGDRDNDGVVMQDVVGVRFADNTVSGHRLGVRFRYGIRVDGLSREIVLARNQVAYQRRGIQVGDRSSEVSLIGNEVTDASEFGMVLGGRGVSSTGDRVGASRDGVLIRGPVLVHDAAVTGVRRGIVLTGGPAVVVGADVRARRTGLLAGDSGLTLRSSRIRGRPAVVGTDPHDRKSNTLISTGPGSPLLALAGIVLPALAFVLHLVQRTRAPSCHTAAARPPRGLRNVA